MLPATLKDPTIVSPTIPAPRLKTSESALETPLILGTTEFISSVILLIYCFPPEGYSVLKELLCLCSMLIEKICFVSVIWGCSYLSVYRGMML